jgi:simple sugar transport system permease protein
VYAVGGSESSAMLMGLRVARTKVGVYAISGFCSALSGLLFTFYSLSGYSLSAVGTELDAIAATVIGGTSLSGGVGTLHGTLIGALIMGVLRNGLNLLGTSSFFQQIVIGIVIITAVLVDSMLKPSAK